MRASFLHCSIIVVTATNLLDVVIQEGRDQE
jgi:hypothetical protein